MTPFRDALTRLAGLQVPGIVHNFDIDALPAVLDRGQTPALLVLLPGAQERQQALFRQQGEAFVALAFSEGPRSVVCLVTHLLLVTPVNAGAGLRSQLPRLVDCMDAYFATLAADVTLGGALLEAAQVGVEPGVFAHGGGDWQGCAFRHRWLLEVTP